LLATNNPGKVREITEILALTGIEILTPAALGGEFTVAETGSTFAENARLKAEAGYDKFGIMTVADDSGLEIDALGGLPGVQSARFMGEDSGYEIKCREVLRLLAATPSEARTARFRCCAALKRSDLIPSFVDEGRRTKDEGRTLLFEDICEGRIAFEMKGTGGFGYDPIFVPDGYESSFAELPARIKNRISHRARAFAKVRDYLFRTEFPHPQP
jgi:XTP/dITP diphosphohydrolase